MSALTRFQPKLTAGHLRYHIDDEKVIDGYLECDGSVVLQNSYPSLFGVLGTRIDSNIANGVLQTSGTSNNINALASGNNTFVYAADGNMTATSTDAITWTITSPAQPILYVGGKTSARVGNTSEAIVSLTDLTGGANTAPQAGDMVVIAVTCAATEAFSQAVTGYTQIASLVANDVEVTNLFVGYKFMVGTPDTTVTIPSSGSGDNGQTVAIQVWRNAVFDSATTVTRLNSVLVDPPAITTTSNNNVLLVIGAGAHDHGTDTYTASYLSNFLTVGINDQNDSVIGFGSIDRPTSGTYDPAQWTFSDSTGGNDSCAAVTVALKPNSIRSLVYGNNTFVYAGTNGGLATSSNAVTWAARTSGTSNNINALTYGDNTFVYAGAGGVLATSTNAATWTARTSGTSNNINALIYANNTFVYAGANSVLATSPDATTWTQRNFNPITYVGGKATSIIGTSDFVSLTDLTGGIDSKPSTGDLVVVAAALSSNSSLDLINTLGSLYTTITYLGAVDDFDTDLLVRWKRMGTTPDTSILVERTASGGCSMTIAVQVWRNAAFNDVNTATQTNTLLPNPPSITTTSNNNVLLVIGAGAHDRGASFNYSASYLDNFLAVSANSSFDSSIGFGSIARPTAGTYDPAAFTYGGTSSTTYSAAAATIALIPLFNVNAIAYGNNTFVIAGDSGVLATSPDAITWTLGTSGTSNTITSITYNNIDNIFAYATRTGQIRYGNLSSWSSINSGTSNSVNSILYSNGFLLYAGDSGIIGTASNYTYDPAMEFILPTSNNIFNEINIAFTPTAFIKYE